jgi:hypothetical protein
MENIMFLLLAHCKFCPADRKITEVSVSTKRIISEALGTSSHQTAPKKIKITQSPQIVDLEE